MFAAISNVAQDVVGVLLQMVVHSRLSWRLLRKRFLDMSDKSE